MTYLFWHPLAFLILMTSKYFGGNPDYFLLLETVSFLGFYRNSFILSLLWPHWSCFPGLLGCFFLFHPNTKCSESLDLNLLCISKSFLLCGLLWFHVFKCNVYNDVSDICIFSLSLSFEFYTYKSNCLLDIATCIHSKLSKSRKVPWVPIFQVLNIISTTKSCQSTSYKYFAVSIAMLSHGLRHLSTGLVQLPPDWFFFQFILPIATASLLSTYLSMYHAILALALSSLVFSYHTVLLIHHAVVMMLFFLPLEHTVLLYTSRIFHILPPLPGMVIYVSSLMAFIIGQASSKCFSWINTLNSHITHTR